MLSIRWLYNKKGNMPYGIRKSPNKNLYWVFNKETGKKFSKKPIPRERAEAQRRAIYASENGYKKRSRSISKRSRKYVKKSLSPIRLRGGGWFDFESAQEGQLKYINKNLLGYLFKFNEEQHAKPIYDLLLWNNKDFEKLYVELYDKSTNKLANQTKMKLDYYGDILNFKSVDLKQVTEDVSSGPIQLNILRGASQTENQYLAFFLNSNDDLKILIPVFKGENDEYEIGGNCFIQYQFYHFYTFRSPVVSGSSLKSILIDYITVDSSTGFSKNQADYRERRSYLLNKLLKDWQNSIDTTGKFTLTRSNYSKLARSGFFKNFKSDVSDVFDTRDYYGNRYFETIQPPPASLVSMVSDTKYMQ